MRFLAFATLLLFCGPANAAAGLSLPLEGYYRVGRYMPVRVEAADVIEGRGVMTTRIDKPAAPAVVPVLVLDQGIDPSLFGRPLRAVAGNERLVGVIGVSEAEVAWLFPGSAIIPIRLDISQTLPGPAVAWEALDAIVSDGPIPGADARIARTLLGSGVVFAVRGSTAPDEEFPWERQGEWWVLRHVPVGPLAAVDAAAYAPVLNWFPGASARSRGLTASLGVIFAIAALSATLLRSRRASLFALAGVTAVALVGLGAWGRWQSPITVTESGIFTIAGPIVQHDRWEYQTTRATETTAFNWRGNTRPMLMSSEQAVRQEVTLECAGDGSVVRITARLNAKEKLACLSRIIEPATTELQTSARVGEADSPMQALVRRAYLEPDIKMLGQIPSMDEQQWPSVVLEQKITQVRP